MLYLEPTMAYTIQAIILKNTLIHRFAELQLSCVDMPFDMILVPLPFDYVDKNTIPFLPLTDEGSTSIGEKLMSICLDLSKNGKVAYIEAEFFGGVGTQACNLFYNGVEFEKPFISETAINHALQWLGIKRTEDNDEFEVLGLGSHRNTEDWIK